MDNYYEDETHSLIRQTAADVAADYDDDYWHELNDGESHGEEFWADCAEAGFLGAAIPAEYGGEGGGIQDLSIITEELSANGALGAGMMMVLTPVFGGVTLTRNGTEEQKETYLPQIASGEMRFCMALTEPNAGHNVSNIDTVAEEDGDEFVIDGSKQWISGVDIADKMLLIARTTPADELSKPTMGISLFLAEPDDDAIERREIEVGIPTPENHYELSIDGYRATEDDIVGTEGMGLYQLFDTVNPERLIGASGAVGIGTNAIERAVDYTKNRSVFGDEPIASYQGIQHPLADAYSKLQAAKLLVRQACAMEDDDDVGRKTVAEVSNMAKLRASYAGQEATDASLQAHGGNGFSRDYGVIELWKGTRLNKTAPGSSEMMRNHIAEHTLGMPTSYGTSSDTN